MKKLLTFLLLSGLVWLSVGQVRASHIVGGNFEMRATSGTPGQYMLYLHMFYDEVNGQPGAVTQTITATIFRKSDNRYMQQVVLNQQTRTAVVYANEACASASSLRTTDILYASSLYLNPATYTDEGGYYIVWERCCRNTIITNILRPGNIGMVFYLEFPALGYQGRAFLNSSPTLSRPNGEYICVNKPFQLSFAATDPDGDQLVYSLVTPYAGNTTPQQPELQQAIGTSSYPLVQWVAGHDVNNQIIGNPSLSINAQTGVLSVRATNIGLHVFTVQIDEYRNGRRIGSVRRDFQLPVVDCPNSTLDKPTIYTVVSTVQEQSTGIKLINICHDDGVVLMTALNANASYQWQKDGQNIAGAIGNTYKATGVGRYTVTTSPKNTCGTSQLSEITQVAEVVVPPVTITPNVKMPVCPGQPVTLAAPANRGTYRWIFNSTDTLAGQTANTLNVQKAGRYTVLVKDPTYNCLFSDTDTVTYSPKPRAVFATQPASRTFCAGDSVRLAAFDSTGYVFTWYRDGQAVTGSSSGNFTIRQGGTYSFETAIGSCKSKSESVAFVASPQPVVVFDSVRAICFSNATLIPLIASPPGGVFSGKGVQNASFSPAGAGPGNHLITYTATSPAGCKTTARRWAVVSPSPQVSLPATIGMIRGETITLRPTLTGLGNATYAWTPAAGLSAANIASPVASPSQNTTYTLTVSNPGGCADTASVQVIIYEKMIIPKGFTPNGDGKNDTWEIVGIQAYPEADVRVFNRWGQEVFYSHGYTTPFNGTYKGSPLPPATYYFVIEPNNGRSRLSGPLTLLR